MTRPSRRSTRASTCLPEDHGGSSGGFRRHNAFFTEYLAAASPAWREQIQPPTGIKSSGPVGLAVSRNQGVATKTFEVDGAIGYIDRIFTTFQDISLDYGAVQNKDKSAFKFAEPANMTAAAHAVHGEIPADLTFNLVDKPGKDSYPITART